MYLKKGTIGRLISRGEGGDAIRQGSWGHSGLVKGMMPRGVGPGVGSGVETIALKTTQIHAHYLIPQIGPGQDA